MRRVVITGLGAITPLAASATLSWQRLLAGQSGLVSLSSRSQSFENLPCTVAATVPSGPHKDGGWNPSEWLTPAEQRKMATFSHYAVAATAMALRDARLLSEQPRQDAEMCLPPGQLRLAKADQIGVSIGSGIGDLEGMYNQSVAFSTGGHKRTSPLFLPKLLINMAAGHVAMKFGITGPNMAATSACTTGAHSIIHGYQTLLLALRKGGPRIVIAGSAESCIHPLALSGFTRARSLSPDPLGGSESDTGAVPDRARSRPFDRQRDGFIVGEGAGVMVLETLESALDRGAEIHAEISGYGMSADAWHMTAPQPEGEGALKAMRDACTMGREAGRIEADEEVGYVNAHATGTQLGDVAETKAISAWRQTQGARTGRAEKLLVSSNKGAIGHLLGAAGAVEAIFTALSIKNRVVPPTYALDDVDSAVLDESGGLIDFVRRAPLERELEAAVSNSFGFGGPNASLLLTRYRS